MTSALSVTMIVVHMIDGTVVQINPEQVTQMRETRDQNSQLPDAVNCVWDR